MTLGSGSGKFPLWSDLVQRLGEETPSVLKGSSGEVDGTFLDHCRKVLSAWSQAQCVLCESHALKNRSARESLMLFLHPKSLS